MSLAFWNNPLVVSSFRVRNRKGSLVNASTPYFLLLVAIGGALVYFKVPLAAPFPVFYLLTVLGIQFLIALFWPVVATSTSIKNEINNRTLDFQRLTLVSPTQFLLGKLLGESASAFFCAIATIPITVYCALILGVPGVNLFVLILVYLTLLAFTILSGAVGLLQQPDLASDKPRSNRGAAGAFIVILLFAAQTVLPNIRGLLASPVAAGLLGLATPLPLLAGIVEGNPWHYCLSCFGVQIPFLVVTPVSLLSIASLFFHVMRGRLMHPLQPGMSRTVAYVTLLIIDFLVAGLLFEPPPLGYSLIVRSAAFWIAHLVAATLLLCAITPTRETLWSWSWRFRKRRPWLVDGLIGSRSPNSVAILAMIAIGTLSYFGLVLWPASISQFPASAAWQFLPDAVIMAFVMSVCLLAFGTLLQWCHLFFGNVAMILFISLLLLITVPAHVAGFSYDFPWLEDLTWSSHLGQWLLDRPPQNWLPVTLLYIAIYLGARFAISQRMRVMNSIVDRRLAEMGVEISAS